MSGGREFRTGEVSSPIASFAELIASMDAHGHTPAVSFYDDVCRRSIDYGDLKIATLDWIGFLQRRLGVRADDRVALVMRNEISFVPIAVAVIALGAVLVPFSPDSDAGFVVSALEISPITAAIFEEQIDTSLREILTDYVGEPSCAEATIYPLETWSDVAAPPVRSMPEAGALMLFTSGTTGRPKGVLLSQAALLANAFSMVRHFGLSGSAQLAVMPLFHAHAFGFGMMTALLSGGHLVLTRGISPVVWKRAIREESVTLTSVAPSLLRTLQALRVKQSDVPMLRAILVSSAPLAQHVAEAFVRRTGIPLVHGWGLSEYTNFATCMRLDTDADYQRECLLAHASPTIGHTLAGVELEVRDSKGEVLGSHQQGEIWVRGPSTMLGYYADTEATRGAIQNGWLRSGDLGYWIDSRYGRLHFISGRLKEIIIRGGEKLAPMAIELSLRRLMPETDQSHWVVVGYPHDLYGEEIGLYVCRELGIARDTLMAALSRLLPDIRPKIVFVGADTIPMTPTGKVQRIKLQRHFAAFSADSGPTRIVTDLRLAEISGAENDA